MCCEAHSEIRVSVWAVSYFTTKSMTVSLQTVEKRVIAILLAGPRTDPYSDTVLGSNGQPATGRYQSDEEIERGCLESDSRVVTAIIETEGHPSAPLYYTTSGTLLNGAAITGHVGVNALVKVNGIPARAAKNMDQMLEVIANPTMYPVASRWFYIFGTILLHNGTGATVTYPTFAFTSACQSPDAYESAVVCGAVALLSKDGAASDFYSYYANLYARQEAAIRGQQLTIPEIEKIAA